MNQDRPLCISCGELCDCGERPHETECKGCSLCYEYALFRAGVTILDPITD